MPASATRPSGVGRTIGSVSTPDGVAGLLAEPHHDTGPSFLTGTRHPGARLTARLWVPAARRPEQVILHQVVDGEPVVTPMTRAGATAAGSWWQGTVALLNPLNRYRFLLLEPRGPRPYLWYHAAGLSDHDVPDATDFKVLAHDDAPQWVLDAIVYQVFPDRFSRSGHLRQAPDWAVPHAWGTEPPDAGDAASAAWYGGDLDGVVSRLDWIRSLGADTVYLTPVFPARSAHRYDSTTFRQVDPLLGGTEALTRLSRALHARGMRLVLDLTTNHTGVTHEWFRAATSRPDAPEVSYYSFTHYPDRYDAWLDVPSLPKLNHQDPALRDLLVRGPGSVTAQWLTGPVEADGWRVDVANMTGRLGQVDLAHQVAEDMRATMRQVSDTTGRPTWLVAEHSHDASRDLEGPGWQGTMNYLGFTRPLWSWLGDPDPADNLTWLGIPTSIPHLPGDAVLQGVRLYAAHLPASSWARSMNLLCSHDTPRVRTVVGSRANHLVAATALFTAPGVPTVFMGDELGATGRTGEHSRTTMPWADGGDSDGATVGERGSWGPVDQVVLSRYRRLAALRRRLTALRRGGTRLVHAGPDMVAWTRTHPAGDVLVVLARRACDSILVPLPALPAGGVVERHCLDGVSVVHDQEEAVVRVGATGPGSAVVLLAPPGGPRQ